MLSKIIAAGSWFKDTGYWIINSGTGWLDGAYKSQRFLAKVQRCVFSLLLLSGLYLYIDATWLQTEFIISILDIWGDSNYPLTMTYALLCLFVFIAVSIVVPFYYFIRYYGSTAKEEFIEIKMKGRFFPVLIDFLRRMLATFLMLYGITIVLSKFPLWLGLDNIPGFYLVQFFLFAKMSSLIIVHTAKTLSLLFPYKRLESGCWSKE